MPISKFQICSISIISPIRNSISNHKTFKIRLEHVGIIDICLVMSMNIVEHIRDIDTSIRLTWKIKFILFEFWKFIIESKYCSYIIFCRTIVIKGTISFIVRSACWKANSSWLFYVKHVSFFVPRIIIVSEIFSSNIHKERTMLLHKSKHWRATRSTISPKNNWRELWIFLTS